MVIDYLPRIPRIPYSDRPHGPKIEPSITGRSFLSLSLLSFPLLVLFFFFHPLSLDLRSREIFPLSLSSLSIVYFLAPRDEGHVIPDLGNAAALIKRCSDTCCIEAHFCTTLRSAGYIIAYGVEREKEIKRNIS